MTTKREDVRSGQCSFCGKSQSEVGRLLAGQGDTYICGECIRVYHQILEDGQSVAVKPRRRKLLKPRELAEQRLQAIISIAHTLG